MQKLPSTGVKECLTSASQITIFNQINITQLICDSCDYKIMNIIVCLHFKIRLTVFNLWCIFLTILAIRLQFQQVIIYAEYEVILKYDNELVGASCHMDSNNFKTVSSQSDAPQQLRAHTWLNICNTRSIYIENIFKWIKEDYAWIDFSHKL